MKRINCVLNVVVDICRGVVAMLLCPGLILLCNLQTGFLVLWAYADEYTSP